MAHFELRSVCQLFRRLLDSQSYWKEVAAAPIGRVTLQEASDHIQTALCLNAVVSVRARVHYMKSHRVGSHWCHSATCVDASGTIRQVVFTGAAASQLRHTPPPSGLRPLRPKWCTWTFEEYERETQLFGAPLLSTGLEVLFDEEGAFAIEAYAMLVMRCCYVPYNPACDAWGSGVEHPFHLQCFELEHARPDDDEAKTVDWRQEGWALLSDIDAMLDSKARGTMTVGSILQPHQPLRYPRWDTAVREAERRWLAHGHDPDELAVFHARRGSRSR